MQRSVKLDYYKRSFNILCLLCNNQFSLTPLLKTREINHSQLERAATIHNTYCLRGKPLPQLVEAMAMVSSQLCIYWHRLSHAHDRRSSSLKTNVRGRFLSSKILWNIVRGRSLSTQGCVVAMKCLDNSWPCFDACLVRKCQRRISYAFISAILAYEAFKAIHWSLPAASLIIYRLHLSHTACQAESDMPLREPPLPPLS